MNNGLLERAIEEITKQTSLTSLDEIRVKYLGKSGLITEEMKKLGKMNPDERKEAGQAINKVKKALEEKIVTKKSELEMLEINAKLDSEKLDISLSGRRNKTGSLHPISKATMELSEIFAAQGYEVKEGPNIEDDWYNFTALNIEENHPARQMHDTFYMNEENMVLRTHTSPIQIRAMKAGKPPFKFVAPGRTYRCDSDITHSPMFHQIEGLYVDKEVNLGQLKYTIIESIKHFFETDNMEFRFRSSFFPFTEPSFEVDIKMPGSDKWLEVLGCGMIHPNVLKNADIDPEEFNGFAFGMGIERFAMLKYGIKDLRQFFESDLRWIKHYSFSANDIPSRLGGLTR